MDTPTKSSGCRVGVPYALTEGALRTTFPSSGAGGPLTPQPHGCPCPLRCTFQPASKAVLPSPAPTSSCSVPWLPWLPFSPRRPTPSSPCPAHPSCVFSETVCRCVCCQPPSPLTQAPVHAHELVLPHRDFLCPTHHPLPRAGTMSGTEHELHNPVSNDAVCDTY